MRSLRDQLTVRLVAGGALLFGAAGVALDWQIHRALTTEFDAALHATAESLSVFTEHKSAGVKVEREGATLPPFDLARSKEVFLLRTVDGSEVQRSLSLGSATLPLNAGSFDRPAYFNATLPDGRTLRCIGVRFFPKMVRRVREQQEPAIEVLLTVGRDRAPLDRTLAWLRSALLLIGAAAVFGVAMLVRAAVRRGLTPVDSLGQAVAAIDASSLSVRLSAETLPAELRPIALRLNELLARLEDSFAREQRFTAAAAHELRTPLSELRALAEVNLAMPATDEERGQSWRDALATTGRMESLAVHLLELTRAENARRVIAREIISVADAIAEAWSPWKALAEKRTITLHSTLRDGLTVETDRELLDVVLGNLCANAVHHAPAHSTFSIDGADDANAVILRFRNRCQELTEEDLPHLFERLWRKQSSRSNGDHHGLGLSLAAEFASLLDATLTAQLRGGEEIEFTLRIPRH